MLPSDRMDPLFEATVRATEEAIVNAMAAARAMTGADGFTVRGLPHDEPLRILKKYNRFVEPVKQGGPISKFEIRISKLRGAYSSP